MQLAIELAGVVIWHHDLRARCVTYNEHGVRLLGPMPGPSGWPFEQFLQRLVHPDDHEVLGQAARSAMNTEEPVDAMARYRDVDGHWLHAMTRRVVHRDASGEPAALLGVAINITNLHDTLDQLRSADERIALVTQGVGMGTWVLELNEQLFHWDAQMWLLRGLEPESAPMDIDRMLSLVHPDDRAVARERLTLMADENAPPQYEFRVVRPDGTEHWIASRSTLVHDAEGRPLRRIGVNWDVTDARHALADRHDRALAIRESEAKSELLARLSHELRTPLNAILGFTRLLISENDESPARRRHDRLLQIEGAGQHLLSLINDVLELARPDGEDQQAMLVPVALQTLVQQAVAMVEAQAAERDLQWAVQVPALAVLADPVRLKQVLLNLLTNAIKYNRPGGRIELHAAAHGGQVRLTVSDTGVGMAAHEVREAFEPFHRLRSATPGVEGMGLGLAIVKTLMQRMSGGVSVRSEPGRGSAFQLWLKEALALPVDEAPSAPAAHRAPAMPLAASHAAARGRLLYIEDNPVNMLLVAELVAQRGGGLRFIGAVTGEEGLAQARAQQPDLILLDMQLPDGHGRDVLARLRADPATRHIPCIALSANAMPADIEAALASGFADYWTKPLDFQAFHQAMDAMFGRT